MSGHASRTEKENGDYALFRSLVVRLRSLTELFEILI